MPIAPGAGEGIVVLLAEGPDPGFAQGKQGRIAPGTRPQLGLHRLDDGSWELTDGPATTFSFDPEGALTQARSGSSRLLLEREGGRVVALSETTTGRWVRLDWEGGRVASQTSRDGRLATYRYRGPHLGEVTRPAGGLSYTIEDARIASLADAAGVTLPA